MSFADDSAGYSVSLNNVTDSTRNVSYSADATFKEFFARPLVVPLGVWTPFSATPFTTTLNPWTTFFTNPRVANRVANYAMMSCTLKVKFMVNGNPFYFGRLMVDYQPLPFYDDSSGDNLTNIGCRTTASQRMHIFIDPTTSEAGTMTLPFVWFKNQLSMIDDEFSLLGFLAVRELNGLKHASGSTIPVDLSVAIWAENVQLTAPTTLESTSLVPQSDEYSSGPISSVATAVSQISGALWSVPVIGPYARATTMLSNMAASIAKAFGYSRPVILSNIEPHRPYYCGNLVNCDASDSSTKLSVDSKQELTIDPRIFGADLGDELVLSRLASIPSYLTGFTWATAAIPSAFLYNIRVTPCLSAVSAGYYPTACNFVAKPFRYWKGTMRYKFQIVASAFHRGRLRVVYDPKYVGSLESNIAFTRIVDLSKEREFTVDVAWANPKTWLRTDPYTSDTSNSSSLGAYATVRTDQTNGVLGIYVLNALTSSDNAVANDIAVNVFVSMTDDAEFAVPTELNTAGFMPNYVRTAQSLEHQSDEHDNSNMPNMVSTDICLNKCLEPDASDLVYMGEKISSFRQLLKRYTFYKSSVDLSTGSHAWTSVKSDFPIYPGYTPVGEDSTTAPAPFTYAKQHILHYLTPAFIGVRGGMRNKYVLHTSKPEEITNFTVSKGLETTPTTLVTPVSVVSSSLYSKGRFQASYDTYSGAVISPAARQPIIETEHPFQFNWRFACARAMRGLATEGYPTAGTHLINITGTTTVPLVLDRYCATAEDFTLFWYCGAPPVNPLVAPAAKLT